MAEPNITPARSTPLHHTFSVAANARVVDEFAAECPPPVMTTSAALKRASPVLLELRHRYLNRSPIAEHVVTFAALYALALRMNLM